uniref:Homing endonuclease LAGLIDADG domain-containing protein n=1 Tax=Dactylella sp. TaxID=1814903 RepID=A0A482DU24_9PEZI|nr:hypothetical protein [Dactylella sp.]
MNIKVNGLLVRSILLSLFHSVATDSSHGLNPFHISGFCDAESSFMINIRPSKERKIGWSVELIFSITLHKKDIFLLKTIQKLWGGNITNHEEFSIQYRISSIKDLELVINHFDKYPLITQKLADYLLFKQAFNLIVRKEHLTIEGIKKLVAIKSSINLGLSEQLKLAFMGVKPVERSLIVNPVIENLNWLAGFVSGEGCFFVDVYKSKTNLGFAVRLIFKITQHSRDGILLGKLTDYFGCGKYYKESNRERGEFRVNKFSDIQEKIIPFFVKFPISGVKALDFMDFCEVAKLIENKEHLTLDGLEKIKKIKSRMNRGRNV